MKNYIKSYNEFLLQKKLTKNPILLTMLFFLFIASCSLFIVIVQQNSIQPKINVKAQTSNFVAASGRKLILNGNVVKFIGVNRYNLATIAGNPAACGGPYSDTDLTNWFNEIKQMKVNMIRIPVFQSYTKSGTDMSKVDQILNLAGQNGIKVVLVLESQWETCTQGGYKYNTWYQSGYLSPYGNYTLSYKDYLTFIVSRYKNNTNVAMWQLMGEAESKSVDGVEDFQSLYNFTQAMSNHIRLLDPNHLISLGTIGFGQPGTGGVYYRQLHSLPNISILEFHDYGFETQAIPPGLQERLNDSIALNKPLMVGEAGIVDHCTGTVDGLTCYTLEQRASYFDAKLKAFYAAGGSSYLIWEYRDWSGAPLLTFDFNQTDPLANTITNIALTLNNTIPTNNPTIIPTPTLVPTSILTPTTIPTVIPTITPTPVPTNDTIAPTVNITAPANNSSFKKGTSIKISAEAKDNVAVTKVIFAANNATVCTSTGGLSPFTCSWKPSRAGSYTVKVTAYDAANNQTSAVIQITIFK